jgi:pilus assembly protein Flp/PilA
LIHRLVGVPAGQATPPVMFPLPCKELCMRKLINRFCRDEDGPTMVEYGLLVGLIGLVVAAGATILGQDVSTMFKAIGTYLAGLPIPG